MYVQLPDQRLPRVLPGHERHSHFLPSSARFDHAPGGLDIELHWTPLSEDCPVGYFPVVQSRDGERTDARLADRGFHVDGPVRLGLRSLQSTRVGRCEHADSWTLLMWKKYCF